MARERIDLSGNYSLRIRKRHPGLWVAAGVAGGGIAAGMVVNSREALPTTHPNTIDSRPAVSMTPGETLYPVTGGTTQPPRRSLPCTPKELAGQVETFGCPSPAGEVLLTVTARGDGTYDARTTHGGELGEKRVDGVADGTAVTLQSPNGECDVTFDPTREKREEQATIAC